MARCSKIAAMDPDRLAHCCKWRFTYRMPRHYTSPLPNNTTQEPSRSATKLHNWPCSPDRDARDRSTAVLLQLSKVDAHVIPWLCNCWVVFFAALSPHKSSLAIEAVDEMPLIGSVRTLKGVPPARRMTSAKISSPARKNYFARARDFGLGGVLLFRLSG